VLGDHLVMITPSGTTPCDEAQRRNQLRHMPPETAGSGEQVLGQQEHAEDDHRGPGEA
jgi:hypothetical protein